MLGQVKGLFYHRVLPLPDLGSLLQFSVHPQNPSFNHMNVIAYC